VVIFFGGLLSLLWLYLLVFIFGYMTCRTFYFFRATRISLSLIVLSQVIYLSSIVKLIESFLFVRATIKNQCNDLNLDEKTYALLEKKIDDEIAILKDKSIKCLITMHPPFYRDALKFRDWDASMQFLIENKDQAHSFWEQTND
jgi:hypothetical protein